MKDSSTPLQLADAIHNLFGIKLSRHKRFKEQMESLMRSGLIEYTEVPIEYTVKPRSHKYIARDQLTKLHNAVLLHAFFPMPKVIKGIFTAPSARLEHAKIASLLLTDRNSVAGIGLLRQEVLRFLDVLASDADLSIDTLPNPFQELPQLSFNGVSNVMQALLLQSASLSNADSMIAHYLSDDLEKAYAFAVDVESNNEIVNIYKQRILQAYTAASEFDQLLDQIIDH
ncbi:hypothetical protein ABIE61_001099 [Marinobacterium sp. MBR-111]|uniref:hypothetical protein n=2 Tax=Marinobacterium TaxID=48075 RepID=UPI003396F700